MPSSPDSAEHDRSFPTGAPSASEGFGPIDRPKAEPELAVALRKAKLRATLFNETQEVPRFGRYVVLGSLGRGGMGMVLEAFDPTLDRRVAVKVLHADVSARHARWLTREAHALARLSHPNVVQVYETGEVQGRAFVAMELVSGRTLQQWVKQQPRPGWKECVEVYLQAGSGLAAAHVQGLVHRDFKPTNAIVDDEGRVRVLDFGLARRAESSSDAERSWDDARLEREPALDESLTTTGTVLGTPAYMPPEQMRGEEADARSDQFSLCVSLYEAVYGQRPYAGRSIKALTASMEANAVALPPKGTRVPAALRRVLLRGLAAEPHERWPSMDALLAELRRLVAPRSRRWLGLGVVGGLVAVGVGLTRYAEVGQRCEGARAELAGVWDQSRADQLEAAFLHTGSPGAADSWARLEPRLDAYARGWAAKHTQVCEATRVTQSQPEDVMVLRMGCLATRRLELRAAVEVLAQADKVRVDNATELVESLPELSRCDDVEALEAELPPPKDADVAAQVRALRSQLAEAWALRLAGQYRDAIAQADAVMERAKVLSYGPLLAEARLRRGQAKGSNDEQAAAVEDLEGAYLLAEEHEHAAVELEAVVELVHLVGHQQGRYEQAQPWMRTALALARRKRTGSRARGEAKIAVGEVMLDRGEPTEAFDQLSQALELLQGVLGPSHTDVATALQLIGIALERLDRLDEALDHQQRALEIRRRATGTDHPKFANILTNIANILERQGHLDEALSHHQHALAIYERTLGPRHTDVAIALNNIGIILDLRGHTDEAIAHHRRALEIREKLLDPGHPDLAITFINLGAALLVQGKRDEALALFIRALNIQLKALGPTHPDVAMLSSNIGAVLTEGGRYEEALVHHQRAVTIVEQSLGERHSILSPLLVNLGDTLRALDRREPSKEAYERSLTITEESMGSAHPQVAYALVGLAELALLENDLAMAGPIAERAAEIRENGEVMPAERAQTRFLLARALGQSARARALAELAREDYAEHRDGNEQSLAEVVAWLAEHA